MLYFVIINPKHLHGFQVVSVTGLFDPLLGSHMCSNPGTAVMIELTLFLKVAAEYRLE